MPADRIRHSVLVVDDEPDVVRSVQDLLRFDYRVLGATRAREGIDILGQEDVDVVMSDQRMPDMTGVELLHHVRETHPATTRLLFTGYADIKAVIEAINRGSVYRYITKPWDAGELQAVIRDAAERHDFIVERQRLLAELQAKNDELTRSNAELAEANALKSNFIQVATHELRTPLAILLPLTYLAVRRPDVEETLQGWLRIIATATDRLRHQVDQLTTMLAVERFERPLALLPAPLAGLLREACKDVEPLVALRRQVLVRDYDDSVGVIVAEASKIRDCLNHLLLNAIKFTPDGGRITLSAARSADGAVEIRVSDTGIGIDPTSMRHVFDPFFTALDVSGHSSGIFEFDRRGLGLGLAVVKAFVEMHGGQVRVESAPGRGSSFALSLPQPPSVSTTSTGICAPVSG
jgi:signal transduction histidine kinase